MVLYLNRASASVYQINLQPLDTQSYCNPQDELETKLHQCAYYIALL